MHRPGVFILLLLTGILLALGCGEDQSSPLSSGKPKGSGEIAFKVSYAAWKPLAAKAAAVEKIDRAAAYVYDGEGNDILEQDLEMAEGRAKGNLTVEARDDLRVALVFYDGETVRYIGEDPKVSVPARGSATAEIVEQYLGTTIVAPDSAYVNVDYRLTWMKRPFALEYEVDEATEPDFSDASTIYSGTDTTFVVEAKHESDAKVTFYYRARAWTAYGWGPWHGQGKTGIAGMEGTIVIDVPVPPDVNGGEIWSPSTVHDITWSSAGVSSVNIDLSLDNGITWSTVSRGVNASLGKYSFTLPGSSSSTCLVRVSDASDASRFDTGNTPFSIQSTGFRTLTLTSPKGGDILSAGSTRAITWTSAGVDKINLEFSNDLGMTWSPIASNISASTGTYAWTLPDGQLPSCQIRITDTADPTLSSRNDTVFSILRTSLTLTAPNGGEQLKAGEVSTVSWSSAGVDKVTIELSTDNGVSWTAVAANISASTGAYLWQIPVSVSTTCLLRIKDAAGEHEDRSDAVFSIAEPDARRITLLAPNGGETLRWNTSCTVRWEATFADMVNIEYSSDNGRTWKLIGTSSAALGSFLWSVPTVTSSQCLLRITESTSLLVTDRSDTVFSIAAPVGSITVTAPNGGETFTGGNIQNITWTSAAIDTVRVEFSSDNGSTWQIIEAEVRADSRACSWKTPDISSTNCLIRVSNYRDHSMRDVSNATFTVRAKESTAPRITVTYPNGGESWAAGSTQTITWTSYNAGSMVNIDFSPDGGATWSRMATDRSIYSGSFSWRLPSLVSSQCRIKVSSVDNAQAVDQSDASFSITSSGASITVVSPNGKEEYAPGSVVEIAWMSLGVSTVKIDYLYGSSWYPVTAGVAASAGKYAWTLSSSEMVSKVRVSDASNATVNDESDNYFTVTRTPTPSLRLTSPIGGERWATGAVKNITWTASGIDRVDLFYEFFTGTGSTMIPIATNVDAAAGSHTWTVPPISAGYTRVKVAVAGGYGTAYTGATFSVPSVRLGLPNGGETLVVGSAKKITWDCTGVSKVNLDYSTDNGATWRPIASNVWADSKAYTWSVPFTRSSQCLVRVSDMEAPEAKDQSDARFTIANSITVIQPDGRESLTEGNTRVITWTSVGVERVNIDFSKDNGTTWTSIATNVAASPGAYAVTVPNIASSYCQFRLTDTQYPNVAGKSTVFTIRTTHGTITLSAPNGGERFAPGEWVSMSWNATGMTMVRIELSTDGGQTWTTLNTRIPANVTSFSQQLPNDAASTRCLFRVSDQEDESARDASDAPFTIEGTAIKAARK